MKLYMDPEWRALGESSQNEVYLVLASEFPAYQAGNSVTAFAPSGRAKRIIPMN
jgi:hypothetical protein